MNKILDKLKFYNPNVKQRYLKQFDEGSALTIGYVLSKATPIENVLNKDLAQFNDQEIKHVMHAINPVNLTSSKRYGGLIKSYIDWAMAKGYGTGSNINVLAGMGDDYYREFVGVKKTTISREELFEEILKNLVNDQDKLPLLLAFEGVAGEDLHEQRYLTIDCIIDDNTLEVPTFEGSTRTLQVSTELIELIRRTNEQDVYYYRNGLASSRIKDVELIKTDYVLKKPAKGTEENKPIEKSVLYSRLRKVGEDYSSFPQLTYKNLQQSGMIYMGYQIYMEKGSLNNDDYKEISERFNYKKLKAVNGKQYYNTTFIKSVVTRDAILELYGVDIDAD